MAPAEPRLQHKLLVWLMGPLMALLVLDTAASYWIALRFSNLAHDRALQEIAREVVLHVRPSGGGPKLDISPAVERVLLTDQDDVARYKVSAVGGGFIGGDPDLPAPAGGVPAMGKTVFYEATMQDQPVRVVATWMPLEGAAANDLVQVQVAETLNKRSRLVWEILASVFIPQLLLIMLAGAVVYFGVSRGLLPLKRLQAAVSSRSHLDLSPIDVRDVPGEVRPLVDEVNELMQRLGATLDFQNRFIADAAHQLKTPVSGLKAQIEIALRESDAARVQHCLAQLYLSADRMSRLVAQLLALARNEPGAAQAIELQPIDLNALAVDVAMRWVPEALKRDIDLGFEAGPDAVLIRGEPDRLRELLNNLVDNAVRYSRHSGRVTVAVGMAVAGEAVLSVSDDSQKIPIEERQRIFERFHRLLGSHADGSGLGLAIVSEIAALHQARITLEEDVDGIGNTFSVFFPLAAQAPHGDL
ncbi:MAG: sensor histidine kinase N-terminal domain-containing protein [Burkholderiaceae bacterium]